MPIKPRQIINSFEAKTMRKRPISLKIADWLTKAFGTVWFLILNFAAFSFWIAINMGKIPAIPVFDPYPYVLLITSVSLEAIILAIIVLISQNRESQITTLREELQLQVELLAEKELTKVLFLLKKLLEANNIKVSDTELDEMLEVADTSYIEKRLDEQLNPKTKSIPQQVVEKVGKTLKK